MSEPVEQIVISIARDGGCTTNHSSGCRVINMSDQVAKYEAHGIVVTIHRVPDQPAPLPGLKLLAKNPRFYN